MENQLVLVEVSIVQVSVKEELNMKDTIKRDLKYIENIKLIKDVLFVVITVVQML